MRPEMSEDASKRHAVRKQNQLAPSVTASSSSEWTKEKSNRKSSSKKKAKNEVDAATAEEKRRVTLEKNRLAGNISLFLSNDSKSCEASRCRKKRKFLIQDLERHAHEVSVLNHNLSLQIQALSDQAKQMSAQLEIYKTHCNCGASDISLV